MTPFEFKHNIAHLQGPAQVIWNQLRCPPVLIEPETESTVAVYKYWDRNKLSPLLLKEIKRLGQKYSSIQAMMGYPPSKLQQLTNYAGAYVVCMALGRQLPVDFNEMDSLIIYLYGMSPTEARTLDLSIAFIRNIYLATCEREYLTWINQRIRLTAHGLRVMEEATKQSGGYLILSEAKVIKFRYCLSMASRYFRPSKRSFSFGAYIQTQPKDKHLTMRGPWLGIQFKDRREALQDSIYFRGDDEFNLMFEVVAQNNRYSQDDLNSEISNQVYQLYEEAEEITREKNGKGETPKGLTLRFCLICGSAIQNIPGGFRAKKFIKAFRCNECLDGNKKIKKDRHCSHCGNSFTDTTPGRGRGYAICPKCR